jgi:amino acid transporter
MILSGDSTSATGPAKDLKRTIGVFGLACAVVNMTIGTGIFVLPSLVAEHLGAAALICYFICGLLIFLIALCFAETGSKVTGTGGTYAYIEAAFGPFAGFLANNIFWISCCLSDAAVANGLSKTLGYFYPPLDAAFRPLLFLLLFGGLAYINIRGAKNGVKFMVISTLAKLIPLLLIIGFGIRHVAAENLAWTSTFTLGDISSATLILFFAFLGIENAVTNSGEFKNPSRVVPLGILAGISVVLVLYVSIQVVTQGILGSQLTSFKDAPLAEVSKRLFAYTGIVLITIGAAISMIGSISGAILAIPRVFFAGARDGIFPKFLGNVHSRYATPYNAIIVYAMIGCFFSVFGAFKQLIILSTASVLLIYLGVVLATIRLRFKKMHLVGKPFLIPGGIIVPVIAVVAIIWLLSGISKQEIIAMCSALAILSLIYILIKGFKGKRQRLTAKVPVIEHPVKP